MATSHSSNQKQQNSIESSISLFEQFHQATISTSTTATTKISKPSRKILFPTERLRERIIKLSSNSHDDDDQHQQNQTTETERKNNSNNKRDSLDAEKIAKDMIHELREDVSKLYSPSYLNCVSSASPPIHDQFLFDVFSRQNILGDVSINRRINCPSSNKFLPPRPFAVAASVDILQSGTPASRSYILEVQSTLLCEAHTATLGDVARFVRCARSRTAAPLQHEALPEFSTGGPDQEGQIFRVECKTGTSGTLFRNSSAVLLRKRQVVQVSEGDDSGTNILCQMSDKVSKFSVGSVFLFRHVGYGICDHYFVITNCQQVSQQEFAERVGVFQKEAEDNKFPDDDAAARNDGDDNNNNDDIPNSSSCVFRVYTKRQHHLSRQITKAMGYYPCDTCSSQSKAACCNMRSPARIAVYGCKLCPSYPGLFCLQCYEILHAAAENNEIDDECCTVELPILEQ